MTVKAWAVKPGELKALGRSSRFVWAARTAMRIEPWRPPGVKALWNDGIRLLLEDAPEPANVAKVARELGNRGAVAANRRDGTKDETLGRCMSYATVTLSAALAATRLPDGPALVKALIDVSKYAGSIAAVMAHGGLVRAPKGKDAVDFAALAMWGAIRADLAMSAAVTGRITASGVRTLAPLWPAGTPAWVP